MIPQWAAVIHSKDLCASPLPSLPPITLAAHLQAASSSGVSLRSCCSQAPLALPAARVRAAGGPWWGFPSPVKGPVPCRPMERSLCPRGFPWAQVSAGPRSADPGCPSPGSWLCRPVCTAPGAAASPAFHLCVFTARREPSCPNSPRAPNFIVLSIYPYISI